MKPNSVIVRLRALGEPSRLAIAHQLEAGPRTATQLLRELPALSQPSLSRHVHILRDAGLLEEARRGRECQYRLADDPLLAGVLSMVEWSVASREGLIKSERPALEKNINTSTLIDKIEDDEDLRSREGDFQEWLT